MSVRPLSAQLLAQQVEAAKLDKVIVRNLKGLEFGGNVCGNECIRSDIYSALRP
ncbi:hypothetical protein MELA_01810 [Candidatus Methylomirabilis lanthanidiphila]|uniref:Uncharacterized protein n=1 Tax=Candidatus Methylomirabilis lanthanidiphila TaxID=2211376 RepID=A0A564ZJY3_9BACT|nr:hypothetical protein [Candidatus Methylomirabilis lanthanidiphila]VUZ85426.1 hypothetical protein MELA_01810 [Candidatus Methylomirabilis lanthanidiphila]